MELSKSQIRKQKKKQRTKEEKKRLRKQIILCPRCNWENTALQLKNNKYKCTCCNFCFTKELISFFTI